MACATRRSAADWGPAGKARCNDRLCAAITANSLSIAVRAASSGGGSAVSRSITSATWRDQLAHDETCDRSCNWTSNRSGRCQTRAAPGLVKESADGCEGKTNSAPDEARGRVGLFAKRSLLLARLSSVFAEPDSRRTSWMGNAEGTCTWLAMRELSVANLGQSGSGQLQTGIGGR